MITEAIPALLPREVTIPRSENTGDKLLIIIPLDVVRMTVGIATDVKSGKGKRMG